MPAQPLEAGPCNHLSLCRCPARHKESENGMIRTAVNRPFQNVLMLYVSQLATCIGSQLWVCTAVLEKGFLGQFLNVKYSK